VISRARRAPVTGFSNGILPPCPHLVDLPEF
jgi:hypothetical protein